jgi:hypothetical protein
MKKMEYPAQRTRNQTHLTQRRKDAEAQRLMYLTESFLFSGYPMIEAEFYRTPLPLLFSASLHLCAFAFCS